jgi:transposase
VAVEAAQSLGDPLAEIKAELAALRELVARLEAERDEYKKLVLLLREENEKLKRGLLGQKAERLDPNDRQLSLSILEMLLGKKAETPATATEQVRAHERKKPTGRKPLPEHLERVELELIPLDVQREGLEKFDRIGEETSETLERRPSSTVVVVTRRPKFARKDRPRHGPTRVLIAEVPELPIQRGRAGPGLLADTIVRRWQDHQPLHRLERIFARDGIELARTTICGWHQELAELARPIVDAMRRDALTQPYLCTDATGVLVRAPQKCRNGHFWVLVAPERHVIFDYTPRHDSAGVDQLLAGYAGYLVADAHAVYDHLYTSGKVIEVGCWSHLRRYFYKTLGSEPERAREALALIGELFAIERIVDRATPTERLAARQKQSRPVVARFFEWRDELAPMVLDETPLAKALGYAKNHRAAFERFLEDGRLPMHNNWSELQLRRQVLGRRNWLFVGSDDAALVNTTFVSLLASCAMHGVEPWRYLRDLLCLLPSWPKSRVLELAPVNCKQTLEQQDTQQRLDANPFRTAILALERAHPDIE